jgi:hypothetical protein
MKKLITLAKPVCIDHPFGEIDAVVLTIGVIDELGVYGNLFRIRSANSKRWLTVAGQKPLSLEQHNIIGMQHLDKE